MLFVDVGLVWLVLGKASFFGFVSARAVFEWICCLRLVCSCVLVVHMWRSCFSHFIRCLELVFVCFVSIRFR